MTAKIGYLMSRFPKITETFILYEMLELERMGMRVEVFPLLHEREATMHAEAQPFVERAHYPRLLSISMLAAQLYWLGRSPLAYFDAWWQVIRGNAASPKFLSRALIVVPVAVWFARKVRDSGIQHVHAHYATHPALAAYVIHKLIPDVGYSITAHAHDIYVERSMLAQKLDAAQFIVTISEYNKTLLRDLYGERVAAKIHVIHCGVDPDVFQPRREPPDAACFTMICVASLEEYKGHPFLLEACARLKAEGIPFQCLLVGDGEDRPALEAMAARLELGEQVVIMGRQPRHRVAELLQSAHVMVLPSIVDHNGKKEGIPVALMEALAIELPVIATDISGIPELVEHEKTGLLVPEKDAEALAQALRRVYDAPDEALTFAKNGREKVLRSFHLQANARELYTLFAQQVKTPTA